MAGPGTTFAGPVISGTKRYADDDGAANTGLCVLSQQMTVTFAGGAAASESIVLPQGSQIVDVFADTTTAWNTGGTTPAAALSVGATAGGTDYVSGVSVLAAGRGAPALTAAQITNMLSIGTNTTVYATVTQSAASGLVDATAGSTTVTILYVQTVQLSAGVA